MTSYYYYIKYHCVRKQCSFICKVQKIHVPYDPFMIHVNVVVALNCKIYYFILYVLRRVSELQFFIYEDSFIWQCDVRLPAAGLLPYTWLWLSYVWVFIHKNLDPTRVSYTLRSYSSDGKISLRNSTISDKDNIWEYISMTLFGFKFFSDKSLPQLLWIFNLSLLFKHFVVFSQSLTLTSHSQCAVFFSPNVPQNERYTCTWNKSWQ